MDYVTVEYKDGTIAQLPVPTQEEIAEQTKYVEGLIKQFFPNGIPTAEV